MTHHGHFVKRWLAIEHHKIIILHVSFDLHIHTAILLKIFFNEIINCTGAVSTVMSNLKTNFTIHHNETEATYQ